MEGTGGARAGWSGSIARMNEFLQEQTGCSADGGCFAERPVPPVLDREQALGCFTKSLCE